MSIWVTSTIAIGIALGITAAITGWGYLWTHLETYKGWPAWITWPASLLPIIIGLYFYAAFMIAQ